MYGDEAESHSAAFIKLQSRSPHHGDFDIDGMSAMPHGHDNVVVVRLLKANAATKRGLTPQFALPDPTGGMKAKPSPGETKVELERVTLPRGKRADKLFSIVVLGASASGKTSLIQRYSASCVQTLLRVVLNVAAQVSTSSPGPSFQPWGCRASF